MLTLREILGEDMDDLNNGYLKELKGRLEADDLTWILGAGISVPAGLPQWDELLMNMWGLLTEINKKGPKEEEKEQREVFERTYDKLMTQLYKEPEYKEKYLEKYHGDMYGRAGQYLKDVNVLEAAEYLWNIIKDQNADHGMANANMLILKVLIKEALRIRMEKGKDTLPDESRKEELKGKLENECVGIIAKILKQRGKGHAIVYNYDDLLEFCLEEIAGAEKKDVWIGCDNHRHPGTQPIHVYHPHGKICMFSNWEPKESDAIVLAESSYYSMESKVYTWANSIQAKAFAEKTCVFVGFSGNDYNFRRIIKNCDKVKKREKGNHYIFIAVDSMVDRFLGAAVKQKQDEGVSMKDDALRAVLLDPAFIFERVQMLNLCYAQTRYWGTYGIVPIWTTYRELPEMIKSLQST